MFVVKRVKSENDKLLFFTMFEFKDLKKCVRACLRRRFKRSIRSIELFKDKKKNLFDFNEMTEAWCWWETCNVAFTKSHEIMTSMFHI